MADTVRSFLSPTEDREFARYELRTSLATSYPSAAGCEAEAVLEAHCAAATLFESGMGVDLV